MIGLELQILLTVMRQGGNAYGVSIATDIESRIGRRHSLGAIYTTLERLEGKKYIISREGEATFERGGRKKRYFELTALGQTVINDALDATNKLSKGIRGLKGANI